MVRCLPNPEFPVGILSFRFFILFFGLQFIFRLIFTFVVVLNGAEGWDGGGGGVECRLK